MSGLPGTALYRLMTWLSPSYPIGAYTYSHGLEQAVETGQVRTGDDAEDWVSTVIRHGGGRVDAALLAAAWQATDADDVAVLDEVVELAAAWRGTAETALESSAQGGAFLTTTRQAWPHRLLEHCAARTDVPVSLPVAVGVAAAAHGVPLTAAATAYLHGLSANLVSAAVRLVPLGQTEGQRILAALEPVVEQAALAARTASLEDVGSAALVIDLCSIHHETQYTRLFRS